MEAAGLEQLRDIHLPAAPSWWPPAPGWWLVAVLALATLAWVAWALRRRWRRGLPLRYARQLYQAVRDDYGAGRIGPQQYLNTTNEVLKRLLIHDFGERAARRASGRRWLELLDAHLAAGATAGGFVDGPGRMLGDARFRPDGLEEFDAGAFHDLVERLLGELAASGGAASSAGAASPSGAASASGAAARGDRT